LRFESQRKHSLLIRESILEAGRLKKTEKTKTRLAWQAKSGISKKKTKIKN